MKYADKTTDPLTATRNRLHVGNHMPAECARALERGVALTCLLVDLDGFAQLNEDLGGSFCDRLLMKVAFHLKAFLGTSDCLARYGPDEFLLVFPDMPRPVGEELARRISMDLESRNYEDRPGQLNLTFSIGIASFPAEGVADADALLARVEESLAKAKTRRPN